MTLPLPKRLVAIVDSLTPALHCLPTVGFAGPVEAAVHPDLASDLEAVLREALSNVARHSGATQVQVQVRVAEGLLTLRVFDNGRGIAQASRSSGLANMRRRAVRHDGGLEVGDGPAGGTRLTWTARV